MAIRSLCLSLAITFFLGYSFTVGLTDPTSILKKTPDWVSIPLFIGCGLLYLLAAWWGFKGFGAHKIMSLLSLGLCAFGLGVYALVVVMQMGSGKAAPGQYDYDFTTLDPTEKAAITQVAQQAGLKLIDAVFTEHWHIADSPAAESTVAESTAANAANTRSHEAFRICVQRGHVTALNLSNHPVRDLALLSKLPKLSDLYLKNCGLTDMSRLQSTRLDRLDVSDNQLTDLKTLRGCPNIGWLTAKNNRLTSTAGVEQFGQMVSTDFTGNPLP